MISSLAHAKVSFFVNHQTTARPKSVRSSLYPVAVRCTATPSLSVVCGPHLYQALETLGRFETMTARLEGESKLLAAARDALSLDPTERDVLGPMQAEITDLREVRSPH